METYRSGEYVEQAAEASKQLLPVPTSDVPLKGGRRIEQDNIEQKKIETNTIELGGTVRQEHHDNTGDGGVNEELRVQVPLRNPNCPYIALTDEEFDDNGRRPDVPGSALFLESYSYGRTGNRFSIVSDTLRLGFCCKSKIVRTASSSPAILLAIASYLGREI